MASLQFNWSSTNPESNITYRLYEDGTEVVRDISTLNFTLLMDGKEGKDYVYYVTAYDIDTRLESTPSNAVTIPFTAPVAPTSLVAGWV